MNPHILREAAHWLVRLDDQPDEAERQAFAAWLAADPQHQLAYDSLLGTLTPLRELPMAPARLALQQVLPASGAARAAKALLLVAALSVPLGLAWQRFPPAYLLADLRTDAGQWRAEALPDGSQIRMDGRSAVDIQFDGQTRTLRLIQGEILVQVAKDAQRPFRVVTEHGSVRALGTRFVVERETDATRLAMLESRTEVQSAGQRTEVVAGQQLRFDAKGLGQPEAVDAAALEQAWDKHQLLIDRQPLPAVLERLARQHSGYLMFDRESLAHLEVTAVLPADDSQSALRLLARSLPIEISHYTPWVTRITFKRLK